MNMLILDFKRDWKEITATRLAEMGYEYEAESSLRDNTLFLSRALRRIVQPKKRKVHYSKEFQFDYEFRGVVNEIVSCFEQGSSVKAYQSRSLKKLHEHDLLLNDWGIHHFHLGNEIEIDGYVERTGPLLFAYIEKNDVYLIGIFKHGYWCKDNLVQILHDNWPSIMQRYQMNVKPDNFSESTRKILRNQKHCNVTITVSDGTTYMGPGGGIAPSGDGVVDVINADKQMHELESWQNHLLKEKKKFYSVLGLNESEIIEIKLVFMDDKIHFYEPNRKILFNIQIPETAANNCFQGTP